MKTLLKWILTSMVVIITANLLPFVYIDGIWAAFILVVLISFLNVFLKPLLILFTIPLTVFTFGLFLLVINASIILICDSLMDSFSVSGFWSALFFSMVLSIFNTSIDKIIDDNQ